MNRTCLSGRVFRHAVPLKVIRAFLHRSRP